MTDPLLSIITVNYNGCALTRQLICSLYRHITQPTYEIIVVDNGSQRDEAVLLSREFPEIIALRSEQNRGFAGGNNLGIRRARGQYLLLLNNDIEIEEDTLHLLCQSLAAHPEAAAICPKIRFFAPPRLLQFAGYTPLSQITLRNHLLGFGRPDTKLFDQPHTTPYAHGAAMMIRRSALSTIGPMPEIYFLYYEELEWSERITRAGYTILYDPCCTVFHKESATTGQSSPLRSFYLTRNRLLFGWRNRQGCTRLLTTLYQSLVALPKSLLTTLCQGRHDLSAAILRGWWDFICLKDKTA